jgi:outer membrane lipoprotein-sorting protein
MRRLLGLLLLLPATSAAADLPPAAVRLEAALANIAGIRADFVQIRAVDLTGEELEARGVLVLEPPHRFRLRYDDAGEQQIAVVGDSLWVLDPVENQAVRFLFDPEAPGSEVFLLFGGGERRLAEVFLVTQEPWAGHPEALHLVPRNPDPGYPLTDLRVLVDDRGLPRRFFYREPTGDTVVFDFVRVTLDPADLESLLRLEVPPGMDVIDGESLVRD